MNPPTGTLCSDCKLREAAVPAGDDWVCWQCDENASIEQPGLPPRVEFEPAEGVELFRGRVYPYEHHWQQIVKAGKNFAAFTYDSSEEAQRVNGAMVRRAKRCGLWLEYGRDVVVPLKWRYRLITRGVKQ